MKLSMFKVKILLVYYLFAGFASTWLLYKVLTQGSTVFSETILRIFLTLTFIEILLSSLRSFIKLAGAPAPDESKSDAVA